MELNFDARNVAPSQAMETIPAGWYKAVIVESEEKETKAGNGSYLQLTFGIIDGDYEGRKQWARLNLRNQNEQAVEIAMRDLSAICHAVGVLAPKTSHDLHDIPLLIKVVIKKNNEGQDSNEIRGYKAVEPEVRKPSMAPASGNGAKKMPWAGK